MIKHAKRPKSFLILFLIVVLFGCQSETAAEIEPTTTAVLPANIDLTPTSTAKATNRPPLPTNTTQSPTATPQPTATPLPTAAPTATPIDWSLIQNGATILYYHDKDLWRSGIDGDLQQPLTEGDLLAAWDLESPEDKWWSGGLMPRPFVSPDGRFIAFTQTGGNMVIVDVADPTSPGTLSSGSTLMAWSPDSRYLAYGRSALYLYDTVTQQSKNLTDPLNRGIHSITWSSDGRYIGFTCCFAEPEGEYEGVEYGEIKQYDQETGLIQTVGQSTLSVAGGPQPLCWQDTGQFDLYQEAEQLDYCTQGGSQLFFTSLSPETQQLARMLYSEPDDPLHFHLLIIEDNETADILWQIELEDAANRLAWSVDEQYLLLNNDYPDLSPIWRLLSDGTSTPEVIIEEAYLIDVIPQWQNQ